jgi:hypothetical protein
MNWNETEKEIIRAIAKAKVFGAPHTLHLLNSPGGGVVVAFTSPASGKKSGGRFHTFSVELAEDYHAKSLDYLVAYARVVGSLFKLGLILKLENPWLIDQATFDSGKFAPDVSRLLSGLLRHEFVALPELDDYIALEYFTKEQSEEAAAQLDAISARARADKIAKIADQRAIDTLTTTRRIGYLSLGVSLVVALGTSIWNSYTYDRNRNVTITNPISTIGVRLTPTTPQDSALPSTGEAPANFGDSASVARKSLRNVHAR